MSAKERTELETLQGYYNNNKELMSPKQKSRLKDLLEKQLNQNNPSGK